MFIDSLKNQKHFDLVNKNAAKLSSPYFLLVLSKDFFGIEKIPKHANFPLSYKSFDPQDSTNSLIEVRIKTNATSYLYFGMKVSKKLGNAVVRNKIKRRIRHIIQIISKMLENFKLGLIVIPYKDFHKVEFALLLSEFQMLFTNQCNRLT